MNSPQQSMSGLQRLPRFKRSPTPPDFRITERDAAILVHLQRLRFLTRDQIARLLFSSGATSSCKRRLTLLYHHRFVDRRYAPQKMPTGSTAAIYCLDTAGAQLVASRSGLRLSELDWRRQENDQDAFFLAHLIATNDVFVALALACEAQSLALEWVDERALRRTLQRELRTGAGSGLAAPIPDGHAVVDHMSGRYSFAIELDRGTVEEKRIRTRVRAYGAWAPSGSYSRHFPDASLRVLFVVSAGAGSRARLQRLKRWSEAEQGRSLFWFATHGDIVRRDALRDDIWEVAGRTGTYSLLPPESPPSARRLPRVH